MKCERWGPSLYPEPQPTPQAEVEQIAGDLFSVIYNNPKIMKAWNGVKVDGGVYRVTVELIQK